MRDGGAGSASWTPDLERRTDDGELGVARQGVELEGVERIAQEVLFDRSALNPNHDPGRTPASVLTHVAVHLAQEVLDHAVLVHRGDGRPADRADKVPRVPPRVGTYTLRRTESAA